MQELVHRELSVIMQAGSLRQAAEALHYTMKGLIRHIQSWETTLGFPLFADLQAVPLQLTPAGAGYFRLIDDLQEKYLRGLESCTQVSHSFRGSLTISIPCRASLYYLPQAVKAFRKQYPDVLVTTKSPSPYTYHDLCNGHSAIYLSPREDVRGATDLAAHPLFRSQLYAVVSATDPLARMPYADLAQLPYRLFVQQQGLPPALQRLQDDLIQQHHPRTIAVPDFTAALQAVSCYEAICLAPGVFNERYKGFKWVPLEPLQQVDFVLCTRAKERRPQVLALVKEIQRVYAGKRPDQL